MRLRSTSSSKVVASHVVHARVHMTMGADLMACLRNSIDELRVTFGHLPEHKEGRPDARAVEQIQQRSVVSTTRLGSDGQLSGASGPPTPQM